MKGLTKVQWINRNRNNRSVLARRYSVLREKTDPILPPLVGLTAGRQAYRQAGRLGDKMQMRFGIFKILYRLNYLGIYFVYYHCNVITVLELYFGRLLPSKAYFKVCS